MNADNDAIPTTLRGLLAAPKGRVGYEPGGAFLLHVFWEAPSAAAARELLTEGLRRCAIATHRDTPCTPTYFFRVSRCDAELCPPPPRLAGDHPLLAAARKKLQVGVPAPAVRAGLSKAGLDTALLDLDPTAELPAALREQPVAVEFTEVYLDERAFVMHAGSRDFLDGHAVIMRPHLVRGIPRTIRLGTPAPGLVERILDPVLHETVAPLADGCTVWQSPAWAGEGSSAAAVFLSLDFRLEPAGGTASSFSIPAAVREVCTTCVSFAHPLRPDCTRLMCVLPRLSIGALEGLASLGPVRGEAHVTSTPDADADDKDADPESDVDPDVLGRVRSALSAAGLGVVTVNESLCVGYTLHAKAVELASARAIRAV